MDDSTPRGLLLSGIYGTGKSSVAEEIATILEDRGTPYAAIDLDWLAWSNGPGAGHDDSTLLARNLGAMMANYRDAGVRRFVLAGAVADAAELAAIRAAIAMPLHVVRLTAPIEAIEARLGGSPTAARADDLATAREWLAAGTGVGLEDAAVDNVGPIRATALEVLKVIGWDPSSELGL